MNKGSKANFWYRIGAIEGQKILLIWDKDAGGMSVTNDIENVVEHIANQAEIDPVEHLIIYRDSEGKWDGWNADTSEFYFFDTTHVKHLLSTKLNFDLENPHT